MVFHDIGLDRLVNSYRNPAVVDRPVTYVSCPGTRHTMDLDNITNSVLVTAGGSLTFQNLAMQVRQHQTGAEPDCSQRCNTHGHTCAHGHPSTQLGTGLCVEVVLSTVIFVRHNSRGRA